MLELTADTMIDIARSNLAHGGGVFETICVHRGVPLFLERHLDRMAGGVQALGMGHLPEPDRIRAFIISWLKDKPLAEGALRLLAADDRLMVMERVSYIPAASVAIGIATGFVRCRQSRLAGIKSANYLENRLLTLQANRDGLFDRIAPNDAGHLTDGGRCNVFVELEGQLVTPPVIDGALPGIVRDILVEASIATERTLTIDMLKRARGGFVTSSLAGVLPVHEIHDIVTLDVHHELVRHAQAAYRAAVEQQMARYGEL